MSAITGKLRVVIKADVVEANRHGVLLRLQNQLIRVRKGDEAEIAVNIDLIGEFDR